MAFTFPYFHQAQDIAKLSKDYISREVLLISQQDFEMPKSLILRDGREVQVVQIKRIRIKEPGEEESFILCYLTSDRDRIIEIEQVGLGKDSQQSLPPSVE